MYEQPDAGSSGFEVSPDIEEWKPVPVLAPSRRSISDWLKRLLACNPFYLISAALLLFGMYRLSVDPHIFRVESAQLVFNFTSLEFYELLLVGTAIVLARRRIWYDATLLVALENLFLFVPFMLVSQAAQIELWTIWALSALAATLAALRLGSMRWGLPALPFTPRLMAGALIVLTANTTLTIVYRILHLSKVGSHPDFGAAYFTNEYCWLLVLPLLCALVNLLPRLRADGKLLVQRRWFPVALFLLWIVGTGVHLYALGYIYDFGLRRELLAPFLWVLAWTVFLRLDDFVAAPGPALRTWTLALPLLTTFVAAGEPGNHVFQVLIGLSVLCYSVLSWIERDNRSVRQLLIAAVALLVAAWPHSWVEPAAHFDYARFVGISSAIFLILSAIASRNPKMALGGALAAAVAVGVLCDQRPDALYWAMQAGSAFLLLHSLRWRDDEHPGASVLRWAVAVIWIVHSIVWIRDCAGFWQPLAVGVAVLALCWSPWFVFRRRVPVAVPVAAAMVALSGPANLAVIELQSTHIGILAIGGSFLLFALGTGLALTKRRWLRLVNEP